MAKTNPGNFFEDFERGRKLVHAVPRTLSEGDGAMYIGLYGDRFPLHSSAEYARSLGYRRETVNDLLVFHTVFGKSVNDVSLNAVANLGYANVRFLAPVRPGDVVKLHVEVARARGDVVKFKGKAMVGEKVAAEAEFAAMMVETPQ